MAYRSNGLGCLVALLFVVRGASGQSAHSTVISVSGGWTSLAEKSSLLRDEGGHVQVSVSRGIQSILSSSLRFDVGYHSIPGVADPRQPMPSSDVWIVTGSVVKDIGSMHAFRPYLVAGAGTISIDQGSGREAHLNLTGGAGLVLPQIGRLRPFVEGRFHRALTGAPNSFIPLSLGLSF